MRRKRLLAGSIFSESSQNCSFESFCRPVTSRDRARARGTKGAPESCFLFCLVVLAAESGATLMLHFLLVRWKERVGVQPARE